MDFMDSFKYGSPKIRKKHLFDLSRILAKIGIKTFGNNAIEIGGNMVSSIVTNIWQVEKELDKLLQELYEIEDIADLDFTEYVEAIARLVKSDVFTKAWTLFSGTQAKN
jgi:hypothetical protein